MTAKVGELTGQARIRIVPPLPWKFDFEGLKDAPITWVGARYRHVMRPGRWQQRDGQDHDDSAGHAQPLLDGASRTCTTTRSRPISRRAAANDKLPDVGVIAQGYTLEVSGENKWLKLMSWIAHDKRHAEGARRSSSTPNVWYTLKLRAANEDGKAMLQGKVWKRDDKEPADWTIELTDPVPNIAGAPGLFGNATNAELFIDNVSVTPNSAN